MKFVIIVAIYLRERGEMMQHQPIPETSKHPVLIDTAVGEGKLIFDGYLQMRECQKNREHPEPQFRVQVPESAPLLEQFREAFNIFSRFINDGPLVPQVFDIKEAP